MKFLDSGMQVQKLLRSFPPFKPLLPFLTPCGRVGLFDHVVTSGRGDDLLAVDVDQAWDFPDRSAVTPQLIGMNDLWDIIFTQKPDQEGFRGLGVAVALQQNFEHEAVLVHCPHAVKPGQPRCSD